MIGPALVAASVVLAAVAALARPAEADQRAIRVFDRTYVCTVAAKNGVRRISADARRGFKERGAWRWHASAGLSNYGGKVVFLPGGGAWDTNWSFGGAAGLSPAQYLPDTPVARGGASYTTRSACIPARTSIALGPAGLDGGVASYFADEYECAAPKRVFLRFRVVFARPASFRLDRDSGALRRLGAKTPVRELKMAVRTEGGRPFLYLEALASGKARIFTAKECSPK